MDVNDLKDAYELLYGKNNCEWDKRKKCDSLYIEQNENLKKRIDKAIEYIEYCLEENCEDSCDYLDNQWIGEKLLEILDYNKE